MTAETPPKKTRRKPGPRPTKALAAMDALIRLHGEHAAATQDVIERIVLGEVSRTGIRAALDAEADLDAERRATVLRVFGAEPGKTPVVNAIHAFPHCPQGRECPEHG